jgi:xylose isomerase
LGGSVQKDARISGSVYGFRYLRTANRGIRKRLQHITSSWVIKLNDGRKDTLGSFKYAACIWALGGAADRFCPDGYTDKTASLKQRIDIAGNVDGMEGIELFDSDLLGVDLKEYKGWLSDRGMKTTCITVNTFGINKFKLGSITHTDKKLREEAKDICKRALDIAADLGDTLVSLWLGSDGCDYSFQVDYGKQWDTLQKNISDIAKHNTKVNVCLEYKLKEPHKYLIVPTVAKALYLAQRCGKNVGVTIDFGHCLMGKEKPAESVDMLSKNKKLFNVHMNDAYREWDDDLIAASVNLHETLEFMYYLDEMGYDGYIGFDIFPFRMGGNEAADLCIKNMRGIESILDRLDRKRLKEAMETLDAGKSQFVISDAILSK